ncbi:MAG TPA: beta-1,6-N-acetylglucosaminyltransferase, partial [Glaciihabitans sp.]|nr:beta-1,6-N-acetylglucosaminyltransferase [Glaciihabitans sp.]
MTESAPPPSDVPPSAEAVRIAYFISSYGSGAQLLRLVLTLRHAEPDSPIVIRHDVFQNKLDPDLFANVDQVYVLAGDQPITWGDMTLEAARWSVFRWILTHLDVDWVVLLSEQDYPIRPLSELRQQIVDSRADALLVGERVDHIADPELRREFELRYFYNYTSLPNIGLERRMPRPIQAA